MVGSSPNGMGMRGAATTIGSTNLLPHEHHRRRTAEGSGCQATIDESIPAACFRALGLLQGYFSVETSQPTPTHASRRHPDYMPS